MLKGISPLFSPVLLAAIYSMGHGDEIVFADAHFPGESTNHFVIRADGLQIEALLDAILPLFALDNYVDDPVVMMACVPGDTPDSGSRSGLSKCHRYIRSRHTSDKIYRTF